MKKNPPLLPIDNQKCLLLIRDRLSPCNPIRRNEHIHNLVPTITPSVFCQCDGTNTIKKALSTSSEITCFLWSNPMLSLYPTNSPFNWVKFIMFLTLQLPCWCYYYLYYLPHIILSSAHNKSKQQMTTPSTRPPDPRNNNTSIGISQRVSFRRN